MWSRGLDPVQHLPYTILVQEITASDQENGHASKVVKGEFLKNTQSVPLEIRDLDETVSKFQNINAIYNACTYVFLCDFQVSDVFGKPFDIACLYKWSEVFRTLLQLINQSYGPLESIMTCLKGG